METKNVGEICERPRELLKYTIKKIIINKGTAYFGKDGTCKC